MVTLTLLLGLQAVPWRGASALHAEDRLRQSAGCSWLGGPRAPILFNDPFSV